MLSTVRTETNSRSAISAFERQTAAELHGFRDGGKSRIEPRAPTEPPRQREIGQDDGDEGAGLAGEVPSLHQPVVRTASEEVEVPELHERLQSRMQEPVPLSDIGPADERAACVVASTLRIRGAAAHLERCRRRPHPDRVGAQ